MLEVFGINTLIESKIQFVTNEKNLMECEEHLSNIGVLENRQCHIQAAGKNLWLLSSKEKPLLEVLVLLDEKTGVTTRLSWRQDFE